MRQEVSIFNDDQPKTLDLLTDYRTIHQGRAERVEAIIDAAGDVVFVAPTTDGKKCPVGVSLTVSRQTLLAVLARASSAA